MGATSIEPGKSRTAGTVLPPGPEGVRDKADPNFDPAQSSLSSRATLAWAMAAIVCFHLAYASSTTSFLIVGYLVCLAQLTRVSSGRRAFYWGLAVGFCTVAPQLGCFWVIFGPAAIVLWLIVAFWIGLFVTLARFCRQRLGIWPGALLMPFLWTGLEYFRSELYYLRFSWINVGYALAETPSMPLFKWLGMYGVGFLSMAAAVVIGCLRFKQAMLFTLRFGLVLIIILFGHAYFRTPDKPAARTLSVAGVQLEFPSQDEVIAALDELVKRAPKTELFVLSEYTFDGPIPAGVRDWCRRNERYLVVGGKDPAFGTNFFDTAFVIGPSGDVVFRQTKSVPIQFMNDGLPATQQRLWDSPWGKLGFCVCYDLSYTRVIDRLVRMGAQALIVPTMDVVDWGRREHELHARVAPVRSAEHGLPIFRVASSGISQWTDRFGRVQAKAGFPGQGEPIVGELNLEPGGTIPVDRWLAPASTGVTGAVLLWLLISALLVRRNTLKGSRS